MEISEMHRLMRAGQGVLTIWIRPLKRIAHSSREPVFMVESRLSLISITLPEAKKQLNGVDSPAHS
jgi:hypothetical protein